MESSKEFKRKASVSSKIGDISTKSKRSMRYSTMRKQDDDDGRSSSSRNWTSTNLGSKYDAGEYKVQSRDVPFTLMNYNVLADYLAQRHPELYSTNVESDIMKWPIRFEKIVQEILRYSCDILCFQEVQSDHFLHFFEGKLRSLGYDGIYKKRTGDKQDGCAIFYKHDKFVLIDQTDVEYQQPLATSCLNRDNIGLLAKFAPVQDPQTGHFVVATTHLLFNPNRQDVKLAQMALLLAELDRFSWTNEGSTSHLPSIITGDFNCQAHHSVYELLCNGLASYRGLTKKSIQPNHGLIPAEIGITDSCQHFDVLTSRAKKIPSAQGRLYHSKRTDTNPGTVESMGAYYGSGTFHHKFGFKSVYNPYAKPKAVTTRQNGYVMVDYILYSRYFSHRYSKFVEGNLKLLQRLSLYTEKQCTDLGHLPNEKCPSDHLSLAAKFLLTANKM